MTTERRSHTIAFGEAALCGSTVTFDVLAISDVLERQARCRPSEGHRKTTHISNAAFSPVAYSLAVPSTTCGWCGRFSNMTRVGPGAYIPMQGGYGGRPMAKVVSTLACDYCNHHLLAWAFGAAEDINRSDLNAWLERMEGDLIWLPARAEQPPSFDDVPQHIADTAQEAYDCRSFKAFRAAALLTRSVVEATAKHLGYTNGSLASKILKMHEDGRLRAHIKDAADEVRLFGNDMAHGDFIDPVDPEEAQLMLTLMSEVLDEVFQSPARVVKAQAARQAKQQA